LRSEPEKLPALLGEDVFANAHRSKRKEKLKASKEAAEFIVV
jgi:hypothetical protein